MGRHTTEEDLKYPSDHTLCACRACGSTNDDAVALLRDMRLRNHNLAETISRLEGKVRKLQREQDGKLESHRRYPEVLEVLEYWKEKCAPNARELTGGGRGEKCLARLNAGFTVAELKRAIDGYAARPYLINAQRFPKGTKLQWKADAELIFRDPQRVQNGWALAEDAERQRTPVPLSDAPATTNNVIPIGRLSPLGQRAVKLAEFGFHIFPLQPRGKQPVTSNGLLDATRDIQRIEAFWRRHPDYNVGVRCGMESDLVVLDVDVGDGTESLHGLETQYGKLPSTASVVTPRGGSHYYFRHPGDSPLRNTVGYPGKGLDVRGDGGYVLAVESVGANGRAYEVDDQVPLADIPAWLLGLLRRREREWSAVVDPSEWERMVNDGVVEGERNNQLTRLAGHLLVRGLQAGLVEGILLQTNKLRCRPPLPDREVHTIVESISRREARRRQTRLGA